MRCQPQLLTSGSSDTVDVGLTRATVRIRGSGDRGARRRLAHRVVSATQGQMIDGEAGQGDRPGGEQHGGPQAGVVSYRRGHRLGQQPAQPVEAVEQRGQHQPAQDHPGAEAAERGAPTVEGVAFGDPGERGRPHHDVDEHRRCPTPPPTRTRRTPSALGGSGQGRPGRWRVTVIPRAGRAGSCPAGRGAGPRAAPPSRRRWRWVSTSAAQTRGTARAEPLRVCTISAFLAPVGR